MRLVQVVDAADLAEDGFSEFQAVVDGCGLRQVHQYLLQNGFVDVQVDPTYLVRLIFLFRQNSRGGRRCAALRQRKDR